MNVFLCFDDQIVTPRLGSILPGVTRRTLLELLTGIGELVVERDVRLSEVSDALTQSRNLTMFTTSTALGIQQVTRMRIGSVDHELGGSVPSSWRRAEDRFSSLTERFADTGSFCEAIMSRSYLGELSDPTRQWIGVT